MKEVQTGTGKFDPARKFKFTSAARADTVQTGTGKFDPASKF